MNVLYTIHQIEMTHQESKNVVSDIRDLLTGHLTENWQIAEAINAMFWWKHTHCDMLVWERLYGMLKYGPNRDPIPRLQLAVMLEELEEWLDA